MNDEREPEHHARNRQPLAYPLNPAPPDGHVKEVMPGVLWIRVHLPFQLAHINLWAIEDGPGWALVDTGIQRPQAIAEWLRIFAEDLGGRPLTRVFATHMHPDHVGMAGWLTRRFDCRLWMTRLEYLNCRVLVGDTGRTAPADGEEFYRRAGWTEDDLEHYRARFGHYGKNVYALPDSYRRIRDGEWIEIGAHRWQVIVGTGHSPEHACLHCPTLGLLISGDQVLPRISSNVSVFPTEPEGNPLGDWLESLDRIRGAVGDDVIVLPAHNEPFRGLHSRLGSLITGHLRGLERLHGMLDQPRRAIDVFGALFARKIDDPHLLSLATGESLAHLNYLVCAGRARRRTDAAGVDWYEAA